MSHVFCIHWLLERRVETASPAWRGKRTCWARGVSWTGQRCHHYCNTACRELLTHLTDHSRSCITEILQNSLYGSLYTTVNAIPTKQRLLEVSCLNLFQRSYDSPLVCSNIILGGLSDFSSALEIGKSPLDSCGNSMVDAKRLQHLSGLDKWSQWRRCGQKHCRAAAPSGWQSPVISTWWLCEHFQGVLCRTGHGLFTREVQILTKNLWKITMNMVFTLDFKILCFPGHRELTVCHSELWCLVSGSYWNTPDSLPVMTSSKSPVHFLTAPTPPAKCLLVVLFITPYFWHQLCTSLWHVQVSRKKFCETLFCTCRGLWQLTWHSHNSRSPVVRLGLHLHFTLSTFLSPALHEGRPDRFMSSMVFRLFLNSLSHWKALDF